MLKYYVYAYIRKSDGTPYYIGKGKGNRAYSKRHKVTVPPRDQIVFLETNLTNIGACALERRYIRWYGLKRYGTGILYNMTLGGEGNSAPRSEEWKRNHAQKMKGRPMSEETRNKMRLIDRSYMKTPEYRQKVSVGRKGIKHSSHEKRVSYT